MGKSARERSVGTQERDVAIICLEHESGYARTGRCLVDIATNVRLSDLLGKMASS
jgi:hypothetical protein